MIRLLKKEDSDQVVAMAREHFAECGMNGKFNESTVRQFVEKCGQLTLGCFEGDECVGYIAGDSFRHFYTGDLEAMAYCWYIKPGHRGGMNAIRLLKTFEVIASLKGVSRIYVGCMVGPKTDKFERVFEKCGYRRSEVHFVKEV